MFRDRTRDQQQIGMPGTCDKPNTEPFEVVEGIVESLDLELATIAGARVDVADAQRTAEHGTNLVLQAVEKAQTFIRLRCGFGDDADRCNLT